MRDLGEVESSERVDRRTREIAIVAAAAALGDAASTRRYAKYALDAGATRLELEEMLYLTAVYAGFQKAIEATHPEIFDSFNSSVREWMADMQRIIPQRSANPTEDWFSRWLFPPDGQEPLSMNEMVMEVGLLVAGGAETTRTLISHGLRIFCDHPDQWELLHDEPDRIPAAIEELLRWISPLNNMFRTAVRDTEVNGQPIAEGERVALLYPAANRDPAVFSDPDRFDVTRAPTMHLAFGHGTHFCLGANLARLEMRLLLEELTARITRLRPVSEPDIEPNVFARAVRRFDLGFDLR